MQRVQREHNRRLPPNTTAVDASNSRYANPFQVRPNSYGGKPYMIVFIDDRGVSTRSIYMQSRAVAEEVAVLLFNLSLECSFLNRVKRSRRDAVAWHINN